MWYARFLCIMVTLYVQFSAVSDRNNQSLTSALDIHVAFTLFVSRSEECVSGMYIASFNMLLLTSFKRQSLFSLSET